MRKLSGDDRVIGYYSERDVLVGCAPTHPDVRIAVEKKDKDVSSQFVDEYAALRCLHAQLNCSRLAENGD